LRRVDAEHGDPVGLDADGRAPPLLVPLAREGLAQHPLADVVEGGADAVVVGHQRQGEFDGGARQAAGDRDPALLQVTEVVGGAQLHRAVVVQEQGERAVQGELDALVSVLLAAVFDLADQPRRQVDGIGAGG
jgi:hypothetical protein